MTAPEIARLRRRNAALSTAIAKLDAATDPLRPSEALEVAGMLSFEESLVVRWALGGDSDD